MKTLLLLLATVLAAQTAPTDAKPTQKAEAKSAVEYVFHIGGQHASTSWTRYHFEGLNSELQRLMSRERGMNSKCLIAPYASGYAEVWIRSESEAPFSEELKAKAHNVMTSFLDGNDCRRITESLKKPNQALQHNAGSRPLSDDSSASETPSSLGPRG
jgi:hypothetical protein